MEKILHFINGEYCEPSSGLFLDNYEPATGKIYSQTASGNAQDVETAVLAAQSAFPLWSNLSASSRAKILRNIAGNIEERFEEFAAAESRDQGKPLWLSRSMDIARSIQNLEFFASAIEQFSSESHHSENMLNYTTRQPIGIVGCISPWNLPLYLFTWKIAPALAAGNTVVAKPSEFTPKTASMLGEACKKAGLPAGVLNIVQGLGSEAGAAIVEHPKIHAISFTGGTATGAEIARTAAPKFKKLSLELGGKNPTIIFGDCNFDEALKTTVRSAFLNQGEICLCGSRIFVEKNIYEQFRAAFVAEAKKLRVGDPFDENNRQGALASRGHYDKVLSYINLAVEEGGNILCGGHAVYPEGRCKDGWFIAPTIIENLPISCRTNQEEIFGPVVTIASFDSEKEALELANASKYGLASVVWTDNLHRAHRVSRQLETGIVWVNCWLARDLRTPFGGMKQSGVGREGGLEALRFFTEPKNICLNIM